MKFKILIPSVFVLQTAMSITGQAATLGFAELWQKIKSDSAPIKKAEHEQKAATYASQRAAYHWLPSVSLGGRVFSTNDPASSFVSTLSQRQITANDFNPQSLNQPGSQVYSRFTLGLDLPLYEGGGKVAQRAAYGSLENLETLKKDAETLSQFVQAAQNFGELNSLIAAVSRLQGVFDKSNELISRYAIGSEANPVGYSGMLGLKSLRNRAQGELVNLSSQKEAIYIALAEKARVSEWSPKSENLQVFLDRELPVPERTGPTYEEAILRAKAEALEEFKYAEKSRFLPKVGLFAEENLNYGSRNTATSYAAGVYLQWSLFNPDTLNRRGQASETYLASVADADGAKEKNNIHQQVLLKSEAALQKNLVLLIESESLLDDQVRVTTRLFRSGAVSALQLVEVMNRRVDLILNLLEVEKALIQVRANRMLLTKERRSS